MANNFSYPGMIPASGDIVGPASSTDNALVRWDGASGKLIQNSVAILTDAGVLSGLTGLSLTVTNVNSPISETLTLTDLSALNLWTLRTSTVTITPAADSPSDTVVNQTLTNSITGTHSLNASLLLAGTSTKTATGTLSIHRGAFFTLSNVNGTTSAAEAVLGQISASGGTVTNGRAFRAVASGAGGTISNFTGFTVDAPTANVTNSYAFHADDQGATNYFLHSLGGKSYLKGYSKIGGDIVAGAAPAIGGDSFSFEIGSSNSNAIGTTYAISNDSFSNPFTDFTGLGIPARVFSLQIESGSPGHGGEAKKVFTSEDASGFDYDIYIGTAGAVSQAVRFTASKSDGAGGSTALTSADVAYSLNTKGQNLFLLWGDGYLTIEKSIHFNSNGTSVAPAVSFLTGDGIYGVAQSVVGINTGGANKDAARFEFSSGSTKWYFNDTLSLKTIAGVEIMHLTGTTLGFFASTGSTRLSTAASLTNNVTSGGTTSIIDDITAASGDATAAKLTDTRNAIYQLAKKLKSLDDAIKAYGLVN